MNRGEERARSFLYFVSSAAVAAPMFDVDQTCLHLLESTRKKKKLTNNRMEEAAMVEAAVEAAMVEATPEASRECVFFFLFFIYKKE